MAPFWLSVSGYVFRVAGPPAFRPRRVRVTTGVRRSTHCIPPSRVFGYGVVTQRSAGSVYSNGPAGRS